jgi:hypothetical protein
MTPLYQNVMKTRPRKYLFPDDFLAEAVKYFTWNDTHPLLEEKVFQYKGAIVRTNQNKVRPYTLKGLATFLNMPVSRIDAYRNKGTDWQAAVEMVEQIIHTQKFENAASNLLNASFIAKDLGMADRQELSGPDGGAIQTQEVTPRERILSKLSSLASRIGQDTDTVGDDG